MRSLHDAVDQLAGTAFEFVIDDLALGVAHFLDDVLFGGLRGDPAKDARIEFG